MEVFAISPASSKPLWFLAVICLLLGAILIALAYTAYASQNSRVQIEADRIRIVGDFWGRAIPFAQLDGANARVIDLNEEPAYAPKRRTLGTGLPGYASGWFRLYNGEKALIYISRRDRVVYVPTSDGYALLLSLAEPEKFLEALARRGA